MIAKAVTELTNRIIVRISDICNMAEAASYASNLPIF